MTIYAFTCRWCGNEFFTNNWRTDLYCGRPCRRRATDHKRRCPNGDNCTTHCRADEIASESA